MTFAIRAFGLAPNNGTPVHGPWTYGNFCGAGGMGKPIDGLDAACQAHDICYGNLTIGANFGGHNAALQACNQALVASSKSIYDQLLSKSLQNGGASWANRVDATLPGTNLTGPELLEFYAARDVTNFFILMPFGNSYHQ